MGVGADTTEGDTAKRGHDVWFDKNDTWPMRWNAPAGLPALGIREAHPAWHERSEGKPARCSD